MILRKWCLYILVLLSLCAPIYGQKPLLDWQVGEELIYKVRWSFIKLGELRLQVLKKAQLNNRPVYQCRINIDSSPGLPFITIHDLYESYIDAEEFYFHLFQSYEKKGSHILYTSYTLVPESGQVKITIEKRFSDRVNVILDSTLKSSEKIYDSLSMLFFARAMCRYKISMNLPVLVYSKFEQTYIHFSGTLDDVEFRNTPVKSFFVEGKLKFAGIAGVKDDFKGWFSPDNQHLPLKASMKAFIGSVTIELQEWKNWNNNLDNLND